MRSFTALSDHDFEVLAADLLSAEADARFEVFSRGPDKGIDLRCTTLPDGPHIVQCKHLQRSGFATLERHAREEKKKVDALDPAPGRYRFVTSQPLTVDRKDKLKTALSPWITDAADILGAEDLDGLLSAHPQVERQHVKLWLTGGNQLDALLSAGTYHRSRQLLEEAQDALPRYVESGSFFEARERLRKERVLILAGPPGIGKTTLARMLLVDAALDGHEPVEISGDVEEGNGTFRPEEAQIFYYDDFLGTTFLQDRLSKNEDKRLTQFIRRVARSSTSMLVLTTREYILRQAAQLYEEFDREGVQARRFVLELDSYTRMERALILYNHIWASQELDENARRALATDDGYAKVIDHPAYNPRLIEYITGLASRRLHAGENADYISFAVSVLNDPSVIWRHAFERQLDAHQRSLLVAVATLPAPVTPADLEIAYLARCEAAVLPTPGRSFMQALRVLEGSFVAVKQQDATVFVEPANPSIVDFVAAWLAESPTEMSATITGAVFLTQLQWLRRAVIAPPSDGVVRAATRLPFAAAVQRLWGSADPGWHHVRHAGSDEVRLGRTRPQPELRASWLARMLRDDPALEDHLGPFLASAVTTIAGGWAENGVMDPSIPVALVRGLAASGRLTPELEAAAKAVLDGSDGVVYAYKWTQLKELRDVRPGLFTEEEWDELVDRCQDWVDDEVADGTNVDRLEELDELTELAGSMGLRVDEEAVEALRERITEREQEQEAEAEADRESRRVDGEAPRPSDDNTEVRALFNRLIA